MYESTLGLDLLGVRAAASENEVAILDDGLTRRTTWGELYLQAMSVAARLADAGLGPGDRVAILAPAGAPFAAGLHACLRLGVAVVPLSPRGPALGLAPQLVDARVRAVLCDGEDGLLAADAVAAAGLDTPVLPLLGSEGTGGGEGFGVGFDAGRDACVLYTSGTTGAPKGVRLTLANHLASSAGCAEALGCWEPHDRWLLVLSPHHVGGFSVLMRSVVEGQTVVTVPRFEERAVIEGLGHDVTLVSLVPAMLERLLVAGGLGALRRLRAVLLGGAPASPARVREWADLGIPVCPTYGLTETCSQVATVPVGAAAELAGAAGLVHSEAHLEVVDAGADGVGEIVVSGPVVSPGYVGEGVAGFLESPHRFRTGDLGRLDTDGVLWVSGRFDDTIITGGENVQPAEVEAVLAAHPGVLDVAVRGVPDSTYGMVLEALVVGDADLASLQSWVGQRLPRFKVPRRWVSVESLPRNSGGKLVRREL